MATLGNPADLRTVGYVYNEIRGSVWLGNASDLEYEIATWFEFNNVVYSYQAVIGNSQDARKNAGGKHFKPSFRDPLKADFLIINGGIRRIIEAQGDAFHAGNEQKARDRARAIQLGALGYEVVNVWQNSVHSTPGFPIPTNASFDRVMEAAIRGIELSAENGGRYLGQQF